MNHALQREARRREKARALAAARETAARAAELEAVGVAPGLIAAASAQAAGRMQQERGSIGGGGGIGGEGDPRRTTQRRCSFSNDDPELQRQLASQSRRRRSSLVRDKARGGDGRLDVVVAATSGAVWALHGHSGKILDHFPVKVGGR